MRRRDFLRTASLAPLLFSGCSRSSRPPSPPLPPGEVFGAGAGIGHLLRDGILAAANPVEIRNIPLLIVGAGVGGLAAGWKLKKRGFSDFVIVDLESEAGGNSRAGKNAVCAYPWGAHYLPLPPPEAASTRELLADLGVLQGDPAAVAPRYDERYLCATPQERLYRDGRWEEGLLPHLGLSAAEEAQQARFFERIAALKAWRGRDGSRAFALPMAFSSRDPEILALDRIAFSDWLAAEGFTAPSLLWLADYACRDDYGTSARRVSAWAGLHYFASRDAKAANAGGDTVLTAPEGNQWLARGMAETLEGQLHPGWLAFALRQEEGGKDGKNGKGTVVVDLYSPGERRVLRYRARQAIFAAPFFVLAAIARDLPPPLLESARGTSYAPWVVANLTLSEFPAHGGDSGGNSGGGAGPAWDNVFYESESLGYVVATHQQLKLLRGGPTVFTWYRALAERDPVTARRQLLDAPGGMSALREFWAEAALADLERAHPDIRELATRIDIARHGHAMVRPTPGFIWGVRQRFEHSWGHVHFAHADVSGLSLFEEAHFRGTQAAERALERL